MRILGIDPGIGRCGWGVIETTGSKIKPISFGCIETSPSLSIEERLEQVYRKVGESIKEFKPDAMSIEELFFNTNEKTAFIVGEARGVILLAASQNNLSVNIYTPLQVKVAVTGYGKAEKNQVGKMVKTILALKEIPKPDDTADALAVALAHAFSAKTRML